MNWDTIKGRWSQLTGEIREKWGLTDDEISEAMGERDRFVGEI
jgi:uncharacterized protein YjbJ (UPF0337 family)